MSSASSLRCLSFFSKASDALRAALVVAVWSVYACSEPVEGDLSSRAPRGSTLNQTGKQVGNDHSGCEVKVSGQALNATETPADAPLAGGEPACKQGTARTGTGTSTGKRVAEVSRPAGMTPPETETSAVTSTSPSTSPAPNPAPPPSPGTALTDGAEIYARDCQRCHGAGNRYSINKTQQGIRAAINRVPAMRNIVLSDQQLRLLSEYLMAQ